MSPPTPLPPTPPPDQALSYESWDVWEPSESDSEMPAITPDTPAFKEMERDMNERAKENAERIARAEKLKDQGNVAFKKGEINQAIALYSEAIQTKKDQKAYYANRALAFLRKRPAPDWASAVKDCNTALDLWEARDDTLLPPYAWSGPLNFHAWIGFILLRRRLLLFFLHPLHFGGWGYFASFFSSSDSLRFPVHHHLFFFFLGAVV
jgi:tetratricopeptide (TPR) repeat protein